MKPIVLNIRLSQYVCFAIALLLMAIVPIVHSNKLLGYELKKSDSTETQTLTEDADGNMIVNTTEIGNKIIGYNGPTPVEITISSGKIKKVKTLPNNETPEFWGAVINSDILESLDGMTLEEASHAEIDAVSGATYSSKAVAQNMHAGVEYALREGGKTSEKPAKVEKLSWKFFITLLIILAGAIIPFFLKSKGYRIVQLILNVVILGFWGGTYLSYSLMVSGLTNGFSRISLLPAVLMLIVAFIFPMFGRVNHYCSWICPYGSIQELAGKCLKYKLPISQKVGRALTVARQVLWFALMWLLWTGLWMDWMVYEPFAAFFFKDASVVTLSIAGAFLLLSFVVQRPYCRFVCPSGSLFKLSEGRE